MTRAPMISAWPNAAEVHFWTATFDDLESPCRWSVLSDDERARAARFARADDQRRFVAGRGWLREVLAAYVNRSPAQLELVAGGHGKPEVVPLPGERVPHFNVSHSGNRMVIGVALQRVGVDVEDTGAAVDVNGIAGAAFDAREAALLVACAGEREGREMFFRIWTRREAWAKATGRGLAAALPGAATPSFPDGWAGTDFPLAARYRAAVAVEGRLDRVTHLEVA